MGTGSMLDLMSPVSPPSPPTGSECVSALIEIVLSREFSDDE